MKLINLKLANEIFYPVGENMTMNNPIITIMAQAIADLHIEGRIVLFCSGSSGAIIAGIISFQIPNCIICHVKKSGENSHSSNAFAFENQDTILIVDDFIAFGRTMDHIFTAIKSNPLSDNKKVFAVVLGGGTGSGKCIKDINPDYLIYNSNSDLKSSYFE